MQAEILRFTKILWGLKLETILLNGTKLAFGNVASPLKSRIPMHITRSVWCSVKGIPLLAYSGSPNSVLTCWNTYPQFLHAIRTRGRGLEKDSDKRWSLLAVRVSSASARISKCSLRHR